MDAQVNLPNDSLMGGTFHYTIEYANSCDAQYITEFRDEVKLQNVDTSNNIYFIQLGTNPHGHTVENGECDINKDDWLPTSSRNYDAEMSTTVEILYSKDDRDNKTLGISGINFFDAVDDTTQIGLHN